MADEHLHQRILAARARTLAWLDSMQAPGLPAGAARISAAHDPAAWPGMLLPGTCSAVMCRDLLGAPHGAPDALASWLAGFRQHDGVFRIPGMTEDTVFKKPDPVETWRYIDFHVTHDSLAAIQALTPTAAPLLDFAHVWLTPLLLKAWLADRDLRDPWQEGTNIVNLASFLLLLHPQEPARAEHAISVLFRWHDFNQDPGTGFWGVGQASDPIRALHAMAGSALNVHLWYALGRPLAHQDKAVDYVLSRTPALDSAATDAAEVDLLVHAHDMIDHRRADTQAWLRARLAALLDFQNADGGFADARSGLWRQDGWAKGYAEPQGISNGFATRLRWIAIAMIADLLWPDLHAWKFCQMIGIGYRARPPAAP